MVDKSEQQQYAQSAYLVFHLNASVQSTIQLRATKVGWFRSPVTGS